MLLAGCLDMRFSTKYGEASVVLRLRASQEGMRGGARLHVEATAWQSMLQVLTAQETENTSHADSLRGQLRSAEFEHHIPIKAPFAEAQSLL